MGKPANHENQENRILNLLQSRGSAWTSAPELSRISLQYCRAIAGLRRRGITIENRVEIEGGTKHGFYRLAAARNFPNPRHEPVRHSAVPLPRVESDLLFQDTTERRHRDDG